MHNQRREVLAVLVLLIDEELGGEELLEVHPLFPIPAEHPFQKLINGPILNFRVDNLVYVVLVHFPDFDGLLGEESQPDLAKIPDKFAIRILVVLELLGVIAVLAVLLNLIVAVANGVPQAPLAVGLDYVREFELAGHHQIQTQVHQRVNHRSHRFQGLG